MKGITKSILLTALIATSAAQASWHNPMTWSATALNGLMSVANRYSKTIITLVSLTILCKYMHKVALANFANQEKCEVSLETIKSLQKEVPTLVAQLRSKIKPGYKNTKTCCNTIFYLESTVIPKLQSTGTITTQDMAKIEEARKLVQQL